jgi:hypothetical protein
MPLSKPPPALIKPPAIAGNIPPPPPDEPDELGDKLSLLEKASVVPKESGVELDPKYELYI